MKILFIITMSFIGNSQLDILILGADNSTNINDVKEKLDSTYRFNSIVGIDITTTTPTLSVLLSYDAILVYTNSSPQDTALLGNRLAACVDSGIGVVTATFNYPGNYTCISGNFTPYWLTTGGGSNSSGTRRTLGTIPRPSHPIMYSVNSYDGGTNSFHAVGLTPKTGTYVVSNYDNGAYLVLAKDSVGTSHTRRVFLNLFPVSSDISSGYRATTEMAQLGLQTHWIGLHIDLLVLELTKW